MGKRRILAALLAACMIVESTAVVSATEAEVSSAETVKTETDPGAEETDLNDGDESAGTENGTDGETEAPGKETPEKPADDIEEGPAKGTEQPAKEEAEGETVQEPDTEEDPADVPEEAAPEEEEDLVGAAEVMEAEPLTDGEIKSDGIDMTITKLKLWQEYGAVGLAWAHSSDGVSDSTGARATYQYSNIYRSETKDGSYELIGKLDKEAYHDPDYNRYRDETVERAAGEIINKIYYYKVSAVYNRTEKDENGYFSGAGELYESVLSEPVSNEGAYYYGYDGYKNSDYIGAYVTDDAGKQLEEVILTEGKAVSLKVTCVDSNKKAVEVPEDSMSNWYLCKQYCTGKSSSYRDESNQLGDDKVVICPEIKEDQFDDSHVYMKALSGTAGGDTYYLIMTTGSYNQGYFMWQIPVRIKEGDGNDEPLKLYTTKDAFCQAVRDALVEREEEIVLYTPDKDDEWWGAVRDYDDIFDFHREREGMKPWEGDYLNLTQGDPDLPFYSGMWVDPGYGGYFNNRYFTKYTVIAGFKTTKAQENQVNRKIDEIIREEGGALYNYQNASDYAKIKAAYDYVRSNVSYIGTRIPIYHTCYSALFNKKATCEGYALLFYRLVRELGVPCRVLMGTDANAHTYNIVKLDGKWYYVDTNAGVLLKGTKDFKPATLQSQYQTAAFKAEYISKISTESYAGNAESQLESVESLTDKEVEAIAANLTGAADAMKATYAINGATIKATGTVQYKEGCTGYLGYEDGSSTNGYFLALKFNVSAGAFKEDGRMTVSYLAEDKTRREVSYDKDALQGGNVNLLVKVTEDPGLKISVDYDGDGVQSKYDAKLYDLDISGLKKESQEKSTGILTDQNDYGIALSSPIIKKSDDGKTITVTYEAVAYSDEVKLEGLPENESKGNYIFLQLNMPESVKGTTLANTVTVEPLEASDISAQAATELTSGWNAGADCYMITGENNSWIRLAMPVKMTPSGEYRKQFIIRWGATDAHPLEQKLYIVVPKESALETRSESALLPGSIAFNGLVSTMYVGQNQNIHITFKKKYEEDEIQVYYTSDAAEVLTVNRITGVMKALKPGTANITVSAVDKNGNTIAAKPAKITVKELPAPTGIKVTSVKDTSVTVSWKANTTGTAAEVYAIPYSSSTFDPKKKKEWKNVVENALKEAELDAKTLAKMEITEKANALVTLGSSFGVESCVAASVPAKDSSVVLNGLQPEKEYLFYVRNVSVTAASTVVFTGATSDKAKTKGLIFDSIRLTLTPENGEVVVSGSVTAEGNDVAVYEVTAAKQDIVAELSYEFLDGEGNKISETLEFKNVKYNSTNKSIVQVQTPKGAQPSLKYGTQVGDARITVSGKDASGVVRESEPIIVRVVKAPSQLKDKSTTLTVGQSIPVTELIGTDLKGTAEGMDLTGIDFASTLTEIETAGCFAISYPDGATKDSAPQKAIITVIGLIDGKSGNKAEVSFKMKDSSSSAMAKIQIKDMVASAIGKITVKDTSAEIEFKPSAAVMETTADRYYTLHITDKVTGVTLEAAADGKSGSLYSCKFDESVQGKTWICEVEGLSSNKAYEAVITAHFKAGISGEATETSAASKPKTFTTKKPLLATAGDMNINYVSLDELRKSPNAVGTKINYSPESVIKLENNGTYVFMAQISNLARTLETDKLKWSISSGDKRAASIKASSSSYEMQLTTTRTGTFTVTAASTVTKEAVATFTVEVIPYQSGGAGSTNAGDQGTPQAAALLPEVDLSGLFKSREEDAA